MAEKPENTILFDWFSVTTKIYDFSSIVEFLGLQSLNWSEGTGARGYKRRYYYDGISIHYDGINEGIWLEMSGQGCRVFETYSNTCNFNRLFQLVLDNLDDFHVTRLDVAYDDFEGLLSVKKIFKNYMDMNFVSKFRNGSIELNPFNKDDVTFYFGSRHSDTLFRIYNKKIERGAEELEHWVRFELQLRDDNALNFIKNYALLDYDVGVCFLAVVNNYLRFVRPGSDSNKSRWEIASWWSKFITSVEKISLYSKKDVEYNLNRCSHYVINQAGNAIDTLIQCVGIDEFLKMLKERKISKDPKYQKLIDDFMQERFERGEGIEF